jgi:hypothetical protein
VIAVGAAAEHPQRQVDLGGRPFGVKGVHARPITRRRRAFNAL